MEITVRDYSERVGMPKITVLKMLSDDRWKGKLKGVTKVKKSPATYNPIWILTVNEKELGS